MSQDIWCEGCGLRAFHCVCDLMEPVAARTPVRVIRNAKERFKSSNTGILLAKLLPNAQVVDVGNGDSPDPSFLATGNLVMVWPGEATEIPENPTLVLLDGTWSQARRMYKRIPGLPDLPCLPLPAPDPTRMRMRNSTVPNGMSTLEAAAAALAILEGPEIAEPLLRLFDRMTERQLRMRGRL